MNRQEWLEARRKGIGGTDAAAILGLSRWRSAVDVWEDKLGIAPEREQTPAMRWGLALEDAIALAFTAETGIRTRRTRLRRARHVKSFPMIGSIDRLANGAVVEIKTGRTDAGFAEADEWRDLEPERRVPPDYYVQVQHYLELTRLPLAYVAGLFSGSDFRVIEIPRDEAFGADLVDEEASFWTTYVETKTQPPVGPDDLDFLARKFPESSGSEIVATPEITLLLDDYLRTVDEISELETKRDGYRATLEDYIGTADRLVAPGAVVSWRSHERTSVGWKEYAGVLESALEKLRDHHETHVARTATALLSDGFGTTDLGDLRTLYSRQSSVRPFRVDRKKEG